MFCQRRWTSRGRHHRVVRKKFSTSSALSGRAIIFTQTGNPSTVLSCLTFPSLAPPAPETANIKFLLSSINPADINVVEGVYPTKPRMTSALATSGKGSQEQPVYVGGNEGLAEIMDVNDVANGLKRRDWVVVTKPYSGTWSSCMNIHVRNLLYVPKETSGVQLSQAHAATMTINPPTAYNLLHNFIELSEGDWVMQNGANSSVGQAVIQIAATKGFKTINFVRNRENIAFLTQELEELGATHVLTYDDLGDKTLRNRVHQWTGGTHIRLGLNCIGGVETTLMARLLGCDAHLVSYGAMSKHPLSLPTSLFIFRNLKSHGFWQSRWYDEHSREEREKLMRTLMALMSNGKLKEPKHEIITVAAHVTDEDAEKIVKNAIAKMTGGRYGKKVLLRIEDPLASR